MAKKEKEEIFVYWDKREFVYQQILSENIQSAEDLSGYFGYIDDYLNDEGELVIYKLTPVKTLKKETTFKFV